LGKFFSGIPAQLSEPARTQRALMQSLHHEWMAAITTTT